MKRRIVSGHELLTDGRRFWVNGPDGGAVARFSPTAGRDVHRPLSQQQAAGECLDCAPDTSFAAFAESVARHYGVEIPRAMWPRTGAAVRNRTGTRELQGPATSNEQRRR